MLEDFRLRVFVKLAQTGSFTAASRELGITQPAVSQNISLLEQAVGEELFTRSRGSVTLTQAGSAFMEYARKILYWYDRLDSELVKKDSHAPDKLQLKLGENSSAEVTVEDGAINIKLI